MDITTSVEVREALLRIRNFEEKRHQYALQDEIDEISKLILQLPCGIRDMFTFYLRYSPLFSEHLIAILHLEGDSFERLVPFFDFAPVFYPHGPAHHLRIQDYIADDLGAIESNERATAGLFIISENCTNTELLDQARAVQPQDLDSYLLPINQWVETFDARLGIVCPMEPWRLAILSGRSNFVSEVQCLELYAIQSQTVQGTRHEILVGKL